MTWIVLLSVGLVMFIIGLALMISLHKSMLMILVSFGALIMFAGIAMACMMSAWAR